MNMKSAPEPVPLSFAQQRLWFIHQLDPELPVYNIPLAIRLTGELNATVLHQALHQIVHRHEVLRTIIRLVDGNTVQELREDFALPLPVADLTQLLCDKSGQEQDLKHHLTEEARRSFDLSHDLPIRIRLFRLAEDIHVLSVVLHHIAADGWSLGVLLRELTDLYNALSEGRESPLEELPVQYSDYSIWQRQLLEGTERERLLAHCVNSLLTLPHSSCQRTSFVPLCSLSMGDRFTQLCHAT